MKGDTRTVLGMGVGRLGTPFARSHFAPQGKLTRCARAGGTKKEKNEDLLELFNTILRVLSRRRKVITSRWASWRGRFERRGRTSGVMDDDGGLELAVVVRRLGYKSI